MKNKKEDKFQTNLPLPIHYTQGRTVLEVEHTKNETKQRAIFQRKIDFFDFKLAIKGENCFCRRRITSLLALIEEKVKKNDYILNIELQCLAKEYRQKICQNMETSSARKKLRNDAYEKKWVTAFLNDTTMIF